MTYDVYLDNTSKLAIQALVLELDEAVRGAAENAVAPAVAQLQQASRRLDGTEETLRQDLVAIVDRLPSNLQGLLDELLRVTSQPEWREELSRGLERMETIARAIGALEAGLNSLAGQLSRQEIGLAERLGESGRMLEQMLASLRALDQRVENVGRALDGQSEGVARMAQQVGALEERVARQADLAEEQAQTLRAVERGVNAVEDRVAGAIARVERTETSLLEGLLSSEKRLNETVRQVIGEVLAESIPPAVREGQATITATVSGLDEGLKAVQERVAKMEEQNTARHELLVRMLENVSGRVILDFEAQNKNAWFLDRLRTQGRWQLVASALTLLAVMGGGLLFVLSRMGGVYHS